ncbi:MAG: prepilin-type N-terminal cleavage/methylation domain-containing protein [Rhodanobacter sp.]|nr:MAG: prepilin-type N-terminal cleavage/methylation domain-containing protein [Rhodanobacter sp.]TAM38732.1 MAG: prepilin-type N-terminal cleavage/methylation domain-containing protein [Rhodanobacter sp.]TAN23190.1 MAG: prepilin-type N-terminal cleavage/methylation domain-containing protein [Rhodanobacter sp.]
MTVLTPQQQSQSSQYGVTLIELMVAMVLGLLVAAGIVTVFSSTSSSNKAQAQLAGLQEEGRFAITRLGTDLRMANGLYCNNSGGAAAVSSSGSLLDHIRAPKVYARKLIGAVGAVSGAFGDVTTAWGGAYPAAPTAPYSMPSFLFMRGYECTLTGCNPLDPTVAGLPAMGTTNGARVKGADVLTVRYVNPSRGWAIGGTGSSLATSGTTGTVASITLNPQTGEPPSTDVSNGDLFMLADCSNAQIFPATASTSIITKITPIANATDGFGVGAANLPTAQLAASAPMVFDVNTDFQTVTYYLKLVSVNNDGNAPFTGALVRRVNGGKSIGARGGSEDELVRGVERLDFRYGVEDASGNTSFLSAADVDSSTNCPPQETDSLTTAGCLWRAVKSIEVSILMDGQVPLYTLSGNDLLYAYSADANPGLLAPGAHAYKPSDQGFPDPLLRREFTALVAVRNFNP